MDRGAGSVNNWARVNRAGSLSSERTADLRGLARAGNARPASAAPQARATAWTHVERGPGPADLRGRTHTRDAEAEDRGKCGAPGSRKWKRGQGEGLGGGLGRGEGDN